MWNAEGMQDQTYDLLSVATRSKANFSLRKKTTLRNNRRYFCLGEWIQMKSTSSTTTITLRLCQRNSMRTLVTKSLPGRRQIELATSKFLNPYSLWLVQFAMYAQTLKGITGRCKFIEIKANRWKIMALEAYHKSKVE